ncbi:NAD(P)-dependent malic enzyme [Natranaerofaba carboxydovora]|uniref:NAD(P)-dependent malic enzyme n=1 Tax=Natranaerofaba carboxydovora TaxID=2742683 RepID=UPI001F136118|nr:malic enzyme-like NAD(P)-binding protein [Natranaerofaba carboxydovora]UMZ74592.1 NAD-dependent malic enzyme [Natranaerofaba carboxydovora]
MDVKEKALELHRKNKGKIEVVSKVPLKSADDMSLAYTPGVAEPCKKIHENSEDVWEYTARGNLVAVVTDGSAVLGLGNIGPKAAMPVMEGKAVLFKEFADVDAFPICVDSQDADEIVKAVTLTESTWGGINLEDITAPVCFEVERKLKEQTELAIFHDDQHGTAIVAAAAVINAVKVLGKKVEDLNVVVNGAGAGGVAVAKILLDMNVKNLILCDSKGPIYKGRKEGMNWAKEELAEKTNKDMVKGTLADAMKGADAFLGVSVAGSVTKDMVSSMNDDAMIFAMANPVPEIFPDEAKEAGARIVGTGRSDFPNQINNVLAFPGIMRGALDVQSTDINEDMKIAAAYAIAELVDESDLKEDYVIPNALDKRVAPAVAKAAAKAAMESGIARKEKPLDEIGKDLEK